jgi:hypothetical protein
MSVCNEPVLSLDGIEELKAEVKATPDSIAKYSRAQLLEKRKGYEGRYPNQPGLFHKNKIDARELFRTRHAKQMQRAQRRMDLAKARYNFFEKIKEFDVAVERIDFELAELKKMEPRAVPSVEAPPKKRARVEERAKPKKRVCARSKRARTPPRRRAKYEGSYEESRELESEESEESEGSEGDSELEAIDQRLQVLDMPDPPLNVVV